MTHSQAWHTIAVAYETEPEERTDSQRNIAQFGLCYAAAELRILRNGLQVTRFNRGLGPCPRTCGIYWFDLNNRTRDHDLLRATFAGFMAAMTQREFDAMIGGNND